MQYVRIWYIDVEVLFNLIIQMSIWLFECGWPNNGGLSPRIIFFPSSSSWICSSHCHLLNLIRWILIKRVDFVQVDVWMWYEIREFEVLYGSNFIWPAKTLFIYFIVKGQKFSINLLFCIVYCASLKLDNLLCISDNIYSQILFRYYF